MMANKYGYGIHEVTYRQCPNCGAGTHPQTVTTPHVGIHMRRCYGRRPDMREVYCL